MPRDASRLRSAIAALSTRFRSAFDELSQRVRSAFTALLKWRVHSAFTALLKCFRSAAPSPRFCSTFLALSQRFRMLSKCIYSAFEEHLQPFRSAFAALSQRV
jgi:hypothetical protein